MKTGEWNHQVLKRMGKNGEMSFAIHEIFYDDAGDKENKMINSYPHIVTLDHKLAEDNDVTIEVGE